MSEGTIILTSAVSLYVTRVLVEIVTSAVAPEASAILVAVVFILSQTSFCILLSSVRIVPSRVHSSGMILLRTPPLIFPTVMTTGALVSSICLLTICCRPAMISELIAIGSTPAHGFEPCAPLPFIFIVNQSLEAMNAPGLYSILPISIFDSMCMPNTTSTLGLSITPSFTISGAPPSSSPGGPSSAG